MAPIAPSTRSSQRKEKRAWPGVPNRYSTISRSRVMRPKSKATVVVDFSAMPAASSTPIDRSVMAASVVSGSISDTAPTNVVLPTPNPPETMIFADTTAGGWSKGTDTVTDPLQYLPRGKSLHPQRIVMHGHQSLGHEVADEHARDADGHLQAVGY